MTVILKVHSLDGFHRGLQIGGRIVTNLRYADDIIMLSTSEVELQELVDRLFHPNPFTFDGVIV